MSYLKWSWKCGGPYQQSNREEQYQEQYREQYQESQQNKRELISTKMDERQLMCQRGINPFTQYDSKSYADHLNVQDKFLKPQDTTNVDYALSNKN
jgi:hypothetical protein